MTDPQPLPTVDENPERCETCRFWAVGYYDGDPQYPEEDHYDHTALGACRRYPKAEPKFYDEWCGEWQAKRAKAVSAIPLAPTPPSLTEDVLGIIRQGDSLGVTNKDLHTSFFNATGRIPPSGAMAEAIKSLIVSGTVERTGRGVVSDEYRFRLKPSAG